MVAFGAEAFHVSIWKKRRRLVPMITGSLLPRLLSYLLFLLFNHLLKKGEAETVNVSSARLGHRYSKRESINFVRRSSIDRDHADPPDITHRQCGI